MKLNQAALAAAVQSVKTHEMPGSAIAAAITAYLKEAGPKKVPPMTYTFAYDAYEAMTPNDRVLAMEDVQRGVNLLVWMAHGASWAAGWHTDPATGLPKERNKGEMLMLTVSEVAEAMEGERKGLMDDHLPHRPMAEVELADVVIRVADYCGKWGYDLAGAIVEKMAYNAQREDHKLETRAAGGKAF